MTGVTRQNRWYPTGINTPSGAAGINTVVGGQQAGVSRVVDIEDVPVYRVKVNLPAGIDWLHDVTSGGGAPDGGGQKILTLKNGCYELLGAHINLTFTTAAGVTSAAAPVVAIGSAIGAVDSATLTSTEADYIASTAFDSAMSAATAQTISQFVPATTSASTNSSCYIDASAADKDLFLNWAATWVKASGSTATLRISAGSYVNLFLRRLADD